jgi:hypothetical protein
VIVIITICKYKVSYVWQRGINDLSVLKKMGGRCAQTGHPLKLPTPTKLARLGHFPPAGQAGRLAGPVFDVYVFSLEQCLLCGEGRHPSFHCGQRSGREVYSS